MARGKSWLLGLVCAGAAGVLLFCSPWVGEGMRRGLAICATVMIPSLCPFLILSDFVARTQVGRMLERPLGGVAKHLYHCPPQLAPAILMSWIGGSPAGARVLAGMLPPDGGKRARVDLPEPLAPSTAQTRPGSREKPGISSTVRRR